MLSSHFQLAHAGGSAIDSDLTFGGWLRRRRRALDLTREELAARVGCSVSALRKFEADELRPSRPLAELLAGALGIESEDSSTFVRFARDTTADNALPLLAPTVSLNRPLTPAPVLTNLPTLPTAIIGRAAELAAVGHLLRRPETRLVTLIGPGGTGKTHLALEVAASLRDTFRDGVFLVSLAPISDPNLVAPTIAQMLNVRETSGRSLLVNLSGYLRVKQLLLLLDNFEQLVAAAPVVAELFAGAPALKVLATSRIPLHVRGEQEFVVTPLALPDPKHPPTVDQLAHYGAVELFVERARDVRPDFAITDANAAAVVEICQQLDGLPLAIELAAARSKIFPPAALLARLGSRLTFLTGGARDAPARQQTLRATIEWSYTLLDEREQTLFWRLAVFVGGFTLAAAEAVCAEGKRQKAKGKTADVCESLLPLTFNLLPLLESLVDKSMVQADPTRDEPRFFMLETLREYALERLAASAEAETVRRQHAQCFLALAEEAEPQLFFATRAHWLERLEREHDNLRAALRWFVDRQAFDEGLRLGGALWPFWEARGYGWEGRMWLAELLSVSASGPRSAARAKVLQGAGSLAFQLGDHALAEPLMQESVAIGRALGHADLVAWSQFTLAELTYGRGQYAAAIAYLEESLALWRAIDDRHGVARALAGLGWVKRLQDDAAGARPLLEQSLALFRQLGDTWGTAEALHLLAQVRERQGDLAIARAYEEESLAIWRTLRDLHHMAFAIVVLGRLAFAQGDHATARGLWNEGLASAAEVQDPWCIGCFLGSYVALAAAQRQSVRALRLAAATDALFQAIGTLIPPATRALVEQGRARATQAVDADTQAAARAEGQAMPLEEVIAYALSSDD